MFTTMLAQATWQDVVPFILMATVPMGSVIAILWKKLVATQDKMFETVEKVIPLASEMSAAIGEATALVVKVHERTPTKQQMDRFSRAAEQIAIQVREGRKR